MDGIYKWKLATDAKSEFSIERFNYMDTVALKSRLVSALQRNLKRANTRADENNSFLVAQSSGSIIFISSGLAPAARSLHCVLPDQLSWRHHSSKRYVDEVAQKRRYSADF